MHAYDQIKSKLINYKPQNGTSPYLKESAVLILFIKNSSELEIILTERSSNLKNHRGEMSFPGGRFDDSKDNDLLDTALRETYEEIGIQKSEIEILGRLSDLPTLTGYNIRPFVGARISTKPIQFYLNETEVQDIVRIPLKYFLEPNIFHIFKFHEFNKKKIPIIKLEYISKIAKKYIIWGATAHILTEFLKIVYDVDVINKNYQRPSISEINEFFEKKLNSID